MSLIEREMLVNAVEDSLYNNPHTDPKLHSNHVHEHQHMLRLIDMAHDVDAATVVHGRWEQGDMYDCGDVCSECDYDTCYTPCDMRYCPNCGARMDGGEEHEAD